MVDKIIKYSQLIVMAILTLGTLFIACLALSSLFNLADFKLYKVGPTIKVEVPSGCKVEFDSSNVIEVKRINPLEEEIDAKEGEYTSPSIEYFEVLPISNRKKEAYLYVEIVNDYKNENDRKVISSKEYNFKISTVGFGALCANIIEK